jgi:hypothetical protein
MEQVLPDMFKAKANLNCGASEEEELATETSSISSIGFTKPLTSPQSPPSQSMQSPYSVAQATPSFFANRASLIASSPAPSSTGRVQSGFWTSVRNQKDSGEVVPLKDRDSRGGDERSMWWECSWEGMDGIGGTNKKGRKCFEKVRISWSWVQGDDNTKGRECVMGQ